MNLTWESVLCLSILRRVGSVCCCQSLVFWCLLGSCLLFPEFSAGSCVQSKGHRKDLHLTFKVLAF